MNSALPFKILGISHLGIAPKSTEQCLDFFGRLLQLQHLGDELVEKQQTMTRMYSSNGPTRLEFLEADPAGCGPIAQYLEKRGSGIQHIAFKVDNVDATVSYFKQNNVALVNDTPQSGAHNSKIIFVHPKATGGILVEFVQESL